MLIFDPSVFSSRFVLKQLVATLVVGECKFGVS